MNYQEIPLSALPSKLDDKDYAIVKLLAPVNVFPEEFRVPFKTLYAKNQGLIGSCVPHSLTYIKEIVEQTQRKIFNSFSVGFIYANRLPTDWQGAGMYPREALHGLLHTGTVLYTDFPHNVEYPEIKTLFDSQKESLLSNAELFKISAYARLYNKDDIKNALMQIGAVTISYPIYDSFYKTFWTGMVPAPSGTFKGYHMMTIVGWRVIEGQTYWIVWNSWGDMWGDYAKCYIQEDVEFQEAWSITDNIVPAPEPKPTYWRVQVGAFGVKENATKYQEMLKSLGYSVYIVLINGLYKCQLGAFSNKDYAEALKDKLGAAGIKAFIVNY